MIIGNEIDTEEQNFAMHKGTDNLDLDGFLHSKKETHRIYNQYSVRISLNVCIGLDTKAVKHTDIY